MQHFILDKDNLRYSKEYGSYHFRTPYGTVPQYIKISEGLEVDTFTEIVKEGTFDFIETRFGNLRFVPRVDTSKRALIFATFTAGAYEEVVIHELSKARVYYSYENSTSLGSLVNVVAVLTPNKPLIISYENTKTHKSRVEYVVYNHYKKIIERKVIDSKTWEKLNSDAILRDYDDLSFNKHEVTFDYMKNLTDEEVNRLKEYERLYNSTRKDA